MNSKHIVAKNILFRVDNPVDWTSEVLENLKGYVAQRSASALVATDGRCLIVSPNKRISLNSGIETLSVILHLVGKCRPITEMKASPSVFLLNIYPDGIYDRSKIRFTTGCVFTDLAGLVKRSYEQHECQLTNKRVSETATSVLVENGSLPFYRARTSEDFKVWLEKQKSERNANPDLEDGETFTATFGLYKNGAIDDSKVTKVPIVGYSGRVDVKKKHWYIYSSASSYGKSYEMDRFTAKYNAQYIDDLNNWTGMRRNVQFVLFDEYSSDSKRHLEYSALKAFTRGHCTGIAGNCKTFGSSYSPRSDVQFIICSNNSLYEIYGQRDPESGRYYISKTTVDQLEDRFHIICLDGDCEEDRRRFTHPKDLTQAELKWECQTCIDDAFMHEIPQAAEDVVSRCIVIIQKILKILKLARPSCCDRFTVLTQIKGVKIPSPVNLPVPLSSIVTAIFDGNMLKKKGRQLEIAMSNLLKGGQGSKRSAVSQHVEKSVTFEDVWTFMKEDDGGRSDIDKVRDFWTYLGPPRNDNDMFRSLPIHGVLSHVQSNPECLQSLYHFYGTEYSIDMARALDNKDHNTGVMLECLRTHLGRSASKDEELQWKDMFKVLVFDPMMNQHNRKSYKRPRWI